MKGYRVELGGSILITAETALDAQDISDKLITELLERFPESDIRITVKARETSQVEVFFNEINEAVEQIPIKYGYNKIKVFRCDRPPNVGFVFWWFADDGSDRSFEWQDINVSDVFQLNKEKVFGQIKKFHDNFKQIAKENGYGN